MVSVLVSKDQLKSFKKSGISVDLGALRLLFMCLCNMKDNKNIYYIYSLICIVRC